MFDGLLVVDKPCGPSSHDVVARVRRALKERRAGHTGTLDPAASGVLPLVLGRATRLAQFLSSAEKTYEAVVRLGFATNTCDATGESLGPVHDGPWPSQETIDRALDAFRGTFLQQPPAYSAKKIDGHPSYKLARRADRQRRAGAEGAVAVAAKPVEVSTTSIELVRCSDDRITLVLTCSAGFYVRSLAHDLGLALGVGGHLASLRRTRSGDVALEQAVPLATLEDKTLGPSEARAKLIPLNRMLPDLTVLTLTTPGVRHAVQGRMLKPSDFIENPNLANPPNPPNPANPANPANPVRLLSPSGDLVGLGRWKPSALLHPFVVLM